MAKTQHKQLAVYRFSGRLEISINQVARTHTAPCTQHGVMMVIRRML